MSIGGPTFKAGLKAAGDSAWASELASSTVLLWAGYGWPATNAYNDMISFGAVTSEQVAATVSGGRTREETLTCEVDMLIYRGGGQEQEVIVETRAFALLTLLADYCRVTDTTLGNTVRHCFLTSYATTQDRSVDLNLGRQQFLTATFTAKYRIS